jgi:signal transduction histidine kinase
MTFQGLSIQQRLPLLICVLLCSVILSFGFASYYSIKKASLEMGKKRLRSLTDQMGSMFTQSSQGLNILMLTTARKDSLKKYILSGGTELQAETLEILNKLRTNRNDSTWVLLELLDSNRVPLLRSGYEMVKTKLPLATIFSSLNVGPDTSKLGKLYQAGDSMYYPLTATVTDHKQVIGYLVGWRSLSASPKGVEQLTQLLGTGATLYVGNRDGSLWTNLNKIVPNPPIGVDPLHIHDFFEYNQGGHRVIAAAQPIASTEWLVLIEFSESTILEAATRYGQWIFIIGLILTALGIFITWLISRSIIKPLNQLTEAATAIAHGDHSVPVIVHRMDELGKLANAFNTMADKVHMTQVDLENKVQARTTQLEIANKEMESFTYSVSHDLRAPLRIITGFASRLEEEYSDRMDDEAKRFTGVIKRNTMKMGNLIDDLLEFSKLERNDIVRSHIDSNDMVHEIISGLDTKDNIKWNIHALPDISGDINTMRQVWVNLISNAVKYSRNREQPYIEIDGTIHEGQTTFFVKDNGVGFDPKYADQIFGVFQRLHSYKEFEGTGVGLAIVEKIISKHGGRIWVEAEKEAGAKFYFNIPS